MFVTTAVSPYARSTEVVSPRAATMARRSSPTSSECPAALELALSRLFSLVFVRIVFGVS